MHNDHSPGALLAAGHMCRAVQRHTRVVKSMTAGAIVIALLASAHAAPPDHPLPPPADYFAGVVEERDVSLVFSYLREALGAAVTGREPPPVEQLIERADAIGNELARRGAMAGRVVLDAIENAVRESLKETPRLPPASPLQRTRY